jgi:hypothetical protein
MPTVPSTRLTKSVEPVELAEKNLGNAVGWLMLCVLFLVISLTITVVIAGHFFNRSVELQRALEQERAACASSR